MIIIIMVMMMTDYNGLSIGSSSSVVEPVSQSFQTSRAVTVMIARYVAVWRQRESLVTGSGK